MPGWWWYSLPVDDRRTISGSVYHWWNFDLSRLSTMRTRTGNFYPLKNPWYPCRSAIATGGTGGGANIFRNPVAANKRPGNTSPLTGSIEMRSKRSGLRIRGRVKNRKDTRAEKMTVSGELMPALTPYFLNLLTVRIVRHHNGKPGAICSRSFFIA